MSVVRLLHDYEVNGSIQWNAEEVALADRRRELTVKLAGVDPAVGFSDWRAVEDWCWTWFQQQTFDREDVPTTAPQDEELEAEMNVLVATWTAGRVSWMFDGAWHAELGNGNSPRFVLEAHSPLNWPAMREWLLDRGGEERRLFPRVTVDHSVALHRTMTTSNNRGRSITGPMSLHIRLEPDVVDGISQQVLFWRSRAASCVAGVREALQELETKVALGSPGLGNQGQIVDLRNTLPN